MPDVFSYYESELTNRRRHVLLGLLRSNWSPPSRQCIRWGLVIALTSQCFIVLVFGLITWRNHYLPFGQVTKSNVNYEYNQKGTQNLNNSLTKGESHDKAAASIIRSSQNAKYTSSHNKAIYNAGNKPLTSILLTTTINNLLPSQAANNKTIKENVHINSSRSNNSITSKVITTSQNIKTVLNKRTTVKNPCVHFHVNSSSYHTDLYCLQDDKRIYTEKVATNLECFIEGTHLPETRFRKRFCVCKQGWSGMYCSKPSVVTNSDLPNYYGLDLSKKPRRIIHALPFSMEFDMLEARLVMLYDVVDAFAILESNYTAFGTPKKRLLKDKLDSGWMKEYHSKIIYISLDYFPEEGYKDGWVADALLRNHITVALFQGEKRILHSTRSDDIIVLTDADELPVREAFLFLRLHYGYPEPFGARYKHNVYGFFWDQGITQTFFGCTLGMLRYVLRNKAYDIRSIPDAMSKNGFNLDIYKKMGARIQAWRFGTNSSPVGWHCSWCFPPEGIKTKLDWSQKSDKPRWGDDPKKKDIQYISGLVKTGTWFDDKTKLYKSDPLQSKYAPDYLLENEERFTYLMNLPSG